MRIHSVRFWPSLSQGLSGNVTAYDGRGMKLSGCKYSPESGRTHKMAAWHAGVLLICMSLVPRVAPAQTREETLQAISKWRGSERETKLREGARKEGGLVWYSSTTAEDSLALSRKFQEAYPFVKVQHLRSSSEKTLERILLESRAGSFKADVVALPEIELEILIQKKLLLKHAGLEQQLFPANVKDARGFWTGIYLTAWVTAYNTKLVSAQAAPKSYADLLNPRWKGQMAMDVEPIRWPGTPLAASPTKDAPSPVDKLVVGPLSRVPVEVLPDKPERSVFKGSGRRGVRYGPMDPVFQRKIGRLDRISSGKEHRSPDAVLQLADVARP